MVRLCATAFCNTNYKVRFKKKNFRQIKNKPFSSPNKSSKKSKQILAEIDVTKIVNYNKISWHHKLIKEGKHKTLLWKNILFRRNLFFTLLMSWQFRVAESRQFCLMSKTSLPRDIKFNLKMITDNMCQKYFCFHKTTEHIMTYRLKKISRL